MRDTSLGGRQRDFEPTAWSVVLQARDRKESDALIARYWKPCYCYIRRRGHDVEDSKDLTQSFFTDFWRRDAIAAVSKSKGRFRSFLLACLHHFLSNEYDRRRAKKRAHLTVPLDFESAESRLEDTAAEPADRTFHRQWANEMMEKALDVLRKEMPDRFELLRDYLAAGRPGELKELAARTGLSPSNVRVILHRTRKKYRDLLRTEIARTVERPEEIDDELEELFAALA